MNRYLTSALLALLVSACGNPTTSATSDTPLEHAARHLDATYQCPMHPEVTSDEAGTCPICGMQLVPVRSASAAEPEVLYYRHPHDPTITSPTPRKDEMGMDFVPVYGGGATSQQGVLELSPVMVNNLGVRTAPATRGRLDATVATVGTVAWDERGRIEVRVRAEGYVERLAVRAEGERVRRGQALFSVFSPRLATAQREYQHALKLGDAALIAASSARLEALGLDRSAIRALEQGGEPARRVTYYAPEDGVVVALGVREGALAEPAMSAMTLAPISRLWVVADVPEAEAARVRVGDRATLNFAALPGTPYEARVLEVLPALADATRTLQLRFGVDNPDGRLAAGMLADVVIQGAAGGEVVLVPAESLIRTGRAERVIVALGEGRFAARDVVAGRANGPLVEILQGMEPGEQVVVSGQFMIDSESQVRESLRRFSEPAAPGDAGAAAHAEHGS